MGDINKALKEKFLCSAQFAQDIEACQNSFQNHSRRS